MSVSKALKSKGSSEPAADVDGAAEDEDEEESEREASRAALPPFLYVGVVLLKKRVLGLEYAVVVATRVEGLEMVIVSVVHSLRSAGWMESNTGSYIVSQLQLLATAGANKAIVLIVLLALLCVVPSFLDFETSKGRMWKGARDVGRLGRRAEA